MKQRWAIIASMIFGFCIIAAALWYVFSPLNSGQTVSHSQLAFNNGVNGKKCWVAVDGEVYEISGFASWEMGQHLPSHGLASCGRDLSKVILESPHGKSVLSLLKKIGPLAQS